MIYCDQCARTGFAIPIPTTRVKVRGPCQLCGAKVNCNGREGDNFSYPSLDRNYQESEHKPTAVKRKRYGPKYIVHVTQQHSRSK